MKHRKIIYAIGLVLFTVLAIDAQEPSAKREARKMRLIKEPVTRESRSAPVFVNYPARISRKGSLTIEGIKIQKKFHKFTKKQYFSLVESCDIKRDQWEVDYNDSDYLLDGFTSYEIKGKVFAYQANFRVIDAEDGYEIGSGILPIYVDEEGNGGFKLRCNDKTRLESLPEWIKPLITN
jgi:hypothetical protein